MHAAGKYRSVIVRKFVVALFGNSEIAIAIAIDSELPSKYNLYFVDCFESDP